MWWLIFALISALGAATLAVVIKLGLKNMDAFVLTFSFALIMTLLFLIVGVTCKKFTGFNASSLTKQEWLLLGVAGIINAVAFLSYLLALQCGTASRVIAIDRLSLVFIIVLSFFFLQEPFTLKTLIGIVSMLAGAFLLIF